MYRRNLQNGPDVILIFAVLFLALFGLIMVSSVSVFDSHDLVTRKIAEGEFLKDRSTNDFYFNRHFVRLIISIIIAFATYFIPIKFWKKMAMPIFVLSSISIWLTLSVGTNLGTNAKNWLILPMIGSIQPSEFLKIAIIFYLSKVFSKNLENVKTLKQGFIFFAIVLIFAVFPIILQPDFGTALIVISVASFIYFIAGANFWHIILGIVSISFAFFILLNESETAKERFKTFFSKEKTDVSRNVREGNNEALGRDWQKDNALIAVGIGGFWGKGFGNGIQKSGYLPESKSDMIFAASSEELGFLRMFIFLVLYIMILTRGVSIIKNSDDKFYIFVASGIIFMISIQAVVNIAMNINLFPITGITLPFVSYGGSSLTAKFFSIAILLKISSHSQKSVNRKAIGRKKVLK